MVRGLCSKYPASLQALTSLFGEIVTYVQPVDDNHGPGLSSSGPTAHNPLDTESADP